MEEVKINTEYIQLGQFLKLAGIIDTGGMVKMYLAEEEVFVNDEAENRRGRKLYPNDQIKLSTGETFVITK
ncbi:S4 domain-containing protein YaaA [Saliterribacillus persicus]|uniref:S4 domain protein YaaA n=1 Tax=Saliterribacillus persicus TaxID=930114 RepID=A0A368XDP8_9BACI|nr:S4 domain-containing protein YaaA [Saliterribacillus persicus]RCW64577.1 S4 domain protein YaaA [Saliterribacillus persicus]